MKNRQLLLLITLIKGANDLFGLMSNPGGETFRNTLINAIPFATDIPATDLTSTLLVVLFDLDTNATMPEVLEALKWSQFQREKKLSPCQ